MTKQNPFIQDLRLPNPNKRTMLVEKYSLEKAMESEFLSLLFGKENIGLEILRNGSRIFIFNVNAQTAIAEIELSNRIIWFTYDIYILNNKFSNNQFINLPYLILFERVVKKQFNVELHISYGLMSNRKNS